MVGVVGFTNVLIVKHYRTIFPWFGYHPSDGNCCVLTNATKIQVERDAVNCKCSTTLERIESAIELKSLLKWAEPTTR